MESIKSSLGNCMECSLQNEPSCILETNCEDDLSKVDVIFVAENPGKEEVEYIPPTPLIGKSGQTFRKYFKKLKLDKLNYLITNVVWCLTLNEDGTTGNPSQKVIDCCKENCFELIRNCNPKLIVIMGNSPLSAFNIAKTGVTKCRGKIYDWEDYKIFVTVHPSYVNRNRIVEEPEFERDLSKVAEFFGIKNDIEQGKERNINITNIKGKYQYSIPEKYYTDNYRLVDVQYLGRKREVIYIFRDKDNKKEIYKTDDKYYCYTCLDDNEKKKIVPYEKLNQTFLHYSDKSLLDFNCTYEGDNRITSKHALDYYLNSKGEAPKLDLNIMYFDIEVDTGESRSFPKPTEANYPINLITKIYHKIKTTYVIDNKTEEIQNIEGVIIKKFKNERDLMSSFISDFKNDDPDILSGWNCIDFDLQYIFNRLPKINIRQESMSKFGEFYVDGKRFVCNLAGCVPLDQCFLYKNFTFTKKENYKLGFIAQDELGYTKVAMDLPINQMYSKLLNKFIGYNIRDTELLEGLENKLEHINLLNEIRTICHTSFDNCSTFGQIDAMLISFLKQRGFGSKNSNQHMEKVKYAGAFVFEPIPGIYEKVVDFDFKSLYPSLIITYNIGINNFRIKLEDPSLGFELSKHPENLPDEISVIFDPTFRAEKKIIKKEALLNIIKKNNYIHTINGCLFENHDKELSVLGEALKEILDSRDRYKKMMFKAVEEKKNDESKFYDTRQQVYKVLANGTYGVLGNKAFRFYDESCAGAITLSGQEALKNSIIYGNNFMESLNLEKPMVIPDEITKKEIFSDEMPDIRKRIKYIVTGDTDSIFCCFEKFKKEKNVENIRGWCKEIENYLNNVIMPHIVRTHNVDPKNSVLKLKNELIISRGLFLAKKRYAIHVINNEGKSVDKMKFMGVEIKRSDYPQKSKEFLTELVNLILKSEKVSITKLMKFVEMKEKEFIEAINNGEKTIARPVSIGKEIEEYKTVPQGTKAMLNFNDLIYDAHDVGSRGYMFKIKGINLDLAPDDVKKNYQKFLSSGKKLEVIAIPDEEQRLPKYIIPDMKEQLKFSFTDRYELMLKPILDIKTKNTVLTF